MLQFAQKPLAEKETFDNIVFIDESSIVLDHHAKIYFRIEGEQPKLKPKSKHPVKVHVWAGMSTWGATDILIFEGIMKKSFYVEEILKKQLMPFLNRIFPDGNYRFQQDNDPRQTQKQGILLLFCPPYLKLISTIITYFYDT